MRIIKKNSQRSAVRSTLCLRSVEKEDEKGKKTMRDMERKLPLQQYREGKVLLQIKYQFGRGAEWY